MNREYIFEIVFKIIKKAIADVLEIKSKKSVTFFQGYANYPVLSYRKNGFPSIFKSPYGSETLIDYEDYFMINPNYDKDKIDLTNYPEYDELKTLILKCDKYLEVYSIGDEDKLSLLEFSIRKLIIDLVCKVLLEYGEENDLSKEQLEKFYEPIENRVLFENLHIDIYVPILFVKFEIQEYNLSDSISIVEMSELFQKSRSEIESYTEGIPEPVLMSATHALKFKNYSISNLNYWTSHYTFGVYENYPIEQISAFFNALRVEGILSGYAQIIAKPIGWVDQYKGDLIDLKGVATRTYPVIFNNYYWNRESFPTVNKGSLINIQQIFSGIVEKDNKKINLACSRLENSFYRNKEGDRIIDIVIGLESILSDGEKGELTP
ncbi:hypothetical protein [Brevibacillus laterosporus]|uniref:hypothetical protein n=1 Tax=Brevibacillus laterosporus TaxID=1465 RepID=UPI00215C9542|nr:hypothetical protein [Brevibacillus laterosporus]MCR8996263.1 hypothetical protein [Brevibacillus laterosporus]